MLTAAACRISGTHAHALWRGYRVRASLITLLLWGVNPAVIALAQAQEMQIITLEHRLAEQVLPAVRPLLEPDGVITGSDNLLFVRTSAANYAQIREAVMMLDRAPRELMITVGQGTVTDIDAAAARVTATIGGSSAQVGINRPPGPDTSVQVVADAGRQSTGLHNISSVRTLEGQETLISTGQSLPVTTTELRPDPRGSILQQTTTYRDIGTGFYASARITGDRVTIDISSRQQNLGSGGIQTSGLDTSVSGAVGEWIPLGGIREAGSVTAGGTLQGRSGSRSSEYTTWIKVESLR
jgi:type II secretory pathway component GspD/PulD (secretin)